MRKLDTITGEYIAPQAPTLSIRPHPLKMLSATHPAPAGMTAAEALYHHGYGYVLLPSCRASIVVERFDGSVLELSKADAFTFTPLPGDVLGVRVLPGKGGGGKSPLSMVVSVAFMVAGMAIPGAGLAVGLANTFGVGSFATMGFYAGLSSVIISGGMAMAGMMVNSFLVSPPTTDIASAGGYVSEAASTTYSIVGSQNKINKYGVMPQLLGGTYRIYPNHGAEPYTEIIGEETYLRQLFVMYGPVKCEDMRIRETPLTDFTDYEVEVREGWASDAPVTLYSNGQDVHQEALSVDLTQAMGWVSRRTNANANEVIFDVAFSRGLYVINQGNGARTAGTVQLEAQYREVGATDWLDWPGGLGLTITGKYTSAHTESFRAVLGGAQYDIRWRRITADDTTGYTIDATAVATLRTITHREPISTTSDLPPLFKVALRIKGSGQLNGVIDQFNFLGTAYLPVWNEEESAFVMQTSASPAWAYVNVLRGPANKKPTPDNLIDVATMLEWHNWTESKSLHINALVDAKTTVRELLLKIARVGRASSSKRDNLYSVAIDDDKPLAVQVLTPRNSWGFEGSMQLPDQPHALRCLFNDKDAGYQQNERIVYAPGYTEATASVFEELQLWGVTSADEAWKAGQFHIAQVKLRPEEFTAWMDIEHLRCQRGSRIRLVHDAVLLGLGQGRIKNVEYVDDETDRRATAITLDSKVPMESGKSYAAGIRLATGVLVTAAFNTVAGESSRIVFTTPILASASPQGGELAYFGEAGKEAEDMLVTNIERGDDYTARLTMRHYAPDVQTADSGTIPPFESKMTRPVDIAQAVPGAPIIESVASDESVLVRLADGTLLPRIVLNFRPRPGNIPTTGYQVQWRELAGAWQVLSTIPSESRSVSINDVEEGQTYDLRLRAISAYGAVSEWVYHNNHAVIGKTSPPPDVPGLLVDARVLRWSYASPPIDFSGFRLAWNPGVDTSWATATPLHAGDWTDTLFTLPAMAGTITVLLRAVDVAGNLSTGSAKAILNLGEAIPANVLETVTLVATPVVAPDTSLAWGEDGSPAWPRPNTALAWEQVFAALEHQVELIVPVETSGARLLLDIDAAGLGLAISYRTDSSEPAWSDDDDAAWGPEASAAWPSPPEWCPWPGALESVQAIPHYFRIVASSGPVQGVVNSMAAILDVPDVEEIIEDITISTTGTRLPLTKTYRRIKHIGLTMQDNGLGATGVRIIDKDSDLGPLLEAIGADALTDARVVGYN